MDESSLTKDHVIPRPIQQRVPLQSEILRVIALFDAGVVIKATDGSPLATALGDLPLMFLWIEFWKLLTKGGIAGHRVFEGSLKALNDAGCISCESTWYFLPTGTYCYRARNGTEWVVESRWANTSARANGEQVILAAPQETWTKFQEERTVEQAKWSKCQTVRTTFGICFYSDKHPHVQLTEKGQAHADIYQHDVLTWTTKAPSANEDPASEGKIHTTGDGMSELPPARHSPDFRSAHWYGADYTFTGNQAAVVKILWEAWENGTPEVSDAHLLTKVGSDCKRLADVFRDAKIGKQQDAWDKMIVSGTTKGTRRLNPPQKIKFDPKST